MATRIDCVVVGYNDASFSEMLDRAESSREISGGYRRLLVNSAPFQGKRLKYGDLFNSALAEATGRPSRLHVGKLPNLGVHYLVSFLRRRSFRAEYVNFYNDQTDYFQELLEQHPRSVAITTTFYYEPQPIQEIVAFVREHSHDTKILVGGPHIFHQCSDHTPNVQDGLFEEMGADVYVFDSQGELTLARICSALQDSSPDLSRVPNLIYTTDGKTFQRTARQPEENDMDKDVVDWSLFDPRSLGTTVQTRTARSCAYKCAFCRYPVLAGSLSLTGVEVIERELRYLHSVGVERLLFIDDTFNIPLNRFKEICRMMVRNKFNFDWFSYFRCANADVESFDLLAESGCKGVFLGIESGDDRVLRAMNKIATVDKYAKGVDHLNRRGIISYASFILGHPGETEESARNTLAFIDDTRPTLFSIETFYYDTKVPIARRAFEFGLMGTAYAWRHNTMDWRRATEFVEEAYRTISNSIVCPLYGFDLWSIAYLMGEGISFSQMRDFLRIAAKMLPLEVGDERARLLEGELISSLQPGRVDTSLHSGPPVAGYRPAVSAGLAEAACQAS